MSFRSHSTKSRGRLSPRDSRTTIIIPSGLGLGSTMPMTCIPPRIRRRTLPATRHERAQKSQPLVTPPETHPSSSMIPLVTMVRRARVLFYDIFSSFVRSYLWLRFRSVFSNYGLEHQERFCSHGFPVCISPSFLCVPHTTALLTSSQSFGSPRTPVPHVRPNVLSPPP